MAELAVLRTDPALERDLGGRVQDLLLRANLLVRSRAGVGGYAGKVILRAWAWGNSPMLSEGYGLAGLACAADGCTVTQETHVATDRSGQGCGQLCAKYEIRLNKDGTAHLLEGDHDDVASSYRSALAQLEEMGGKFSADKFATSYEYGDPTSDAMAANFAQRIDMTTHEIRDPAIRAAAEFAFSHGTKSQYIDLK